MKNKTKTIHLFVHFRFKMNPEKLKQLQDQVRIGGKVCYDYVRLFKVPHYTVMFTSDQAKT